MVPERRLVISRLLVIADPDKDQIPLIILRPVRIILPVDLICRRPGILLILQLNQNRGMIRRLRIKFKYLFSTPIAQNTSCSSLWADRAVSPLVRPLEPLRSVR